MIMIEYNKDEIKPILSLFFIDRKNGSSHRQEPDRQSELSNSDLPLNFKF